MDGGIDEDFGTLPRPASRFHLSLGAEGGDEGGEDDRPIHHQLCHLAHAADILHPVLVGKAEGPGSGRAARLSPAVQRMVAARLVQRLLTSLATVDLQAKPREPKHRADPGPRHAPPCRSVFVMHIGRAAQRVDHPQPGAVDETVTPG